VLGTRPARRSGRSGARRRAESAAGQGSESVAGRDRTCGAPRFRRALYRLSYGHEYERGWDRTSGLLCVRQALVPAELLALDPGQGVEPRPPGSEPGVLPVRRSRNDLRAGALAPERPPASLVIRRSVHLQAEIHAAARPFVPMSRTGSCRTMFSKPLALLFDPGSRVLGRRRASSWRSFGAGCMRCGEKRHW